MHQLATRQVLMGLEGCDLPHTLARDYGSHIGIGLVHGQLSRAGRIDLDLGGEQQLWSGMVGLRSGGYPTASE